MTKNSLYDSIVFNKQELLTPKYKDVRVLVIDQDPSISLSLSQALHGCAELFIDQSFNNTGLKLLLRKNRYDLIILDSQFGFDNSLEFLKQKNNFGINTPVLIVTNPDNNNFVQEAFVDKVSDFLLRDENWNSALKDISQKYLMKYIYTNFSKKQEARTLIQAKFLHQFHQ